jgi:hypothetical protein
MAANRGLTPTARTNDAGRHRLNLMVNNIDAAPKHDSTDSGTLPEVYQQLWRYQNEAGSGYQGAF